MYFQISFQFTSCFILVLIYFSVKFKFIPQKYVNFLLALLGHHNNNNNNMIYIALYTKVLKRFTMEEETRIIQLT